MCTCVICTVVKAIVIFLFCVKLLFNSSKIFVAQITNSIIIDMVSVNTMNTFPQVTVDDESMIKRFDHTITAITISSSLVVVVVFGGESSSGAMLSDTVVLEFGEYTIVVKHSVLHVCIMICKYQYVLHCEHRTWCFNTS